MCGIVGAFCQNKNKVSLNNIKLMNDTIAHRGPDNSNVQRLEEYVCFGHRRLSIIDLSNHANQPMTTLDERFTIVYNGELYNFKEIKKELIDKGYKFYTNSDTEVVLNAYAEWKEDAFIKFNGMFALAIWDKKYKRLVLARDRYGIKPLYYTWVNGTFLFASEQKAFMQYPGFNKALDLEVLKEYFTFQNIFTNKTFYKNVCILEAGNYAFLNIDNYMMEKHRYWDFDFEEKKSYKNEKEYIEELTYLFKKAVNRQLVSDVPVGTYLSGGMDSGAITAVAAQSIQAIKSFTCGFDLHSASSLEQLYDEREKAEHLSYFCKSEHYEMVLKSGDMERSMKEVVWHIEEPRVGQSYPNYYAASLASKFGKVVLSGAGGDELFGGYPWRYYRSVKNRTFDEYVDKYYEFWQRLIPSDRVKKFFSPVQNEIQCVDTKEIFKGVFEKDKKHQISPEQCVNHSMYFEAKTFLHGLLIVEDKLSMAHGLETRVPFLDNELVDFSLKIPVGMKLNNLQEIVKIDENELGGKKEKYYQRTKDGKTILRKAMNNIVPEETLQGIKQGFSAPDASWYRNESINYVKDVIENANSPIYNYFDKITVQELVNEHLQGISNRRLLIWSLLYFDEWCKCFL